MLWLAIALLSAAPAAAQDAPLRELGTDRPDKTESPYTVDNGHVQLEFDLATFTHDRTGDVRTDSVSIAPVNLKLGVGRNTDVQLLVEPYMRRTVTDRATGMRSRIDGFGDVTLRVKHNLWGNDGGTTALALMPFVTLPTNAGALGSDKAEFGVIVPLAVELSDRIGLGLMTEVDMVEQADGSGYVPSLVNSATASFGLTGRLNLYTELYTERAAERGSGWIVTGDTGLTYAIGEDAQLDAGVNLGLSRAAEDVNLFVGFSRRF